MAKLSRKQLLKKDDAFLSAASQSAKWLGSHRMQVIAGSIATVAAILAIWGAVEYTRARDIKASALFEQGLELLEADVLLQGSNRLPEDSADTAEPTADPPTFADDNAKWTAARDQFQRVVDEGGGSGVVTLARFLLADLYEKLEDVEAAEREFGVLVDELGSGDTLSFLAVERAAYLHESRGDPDGALRLLSKLVNVEQGFYNDHATYHQARIYLAKGETDRARNLLERIQKDFPESSVLARVRNRLAELPAKPAAPELLKEAPDPAATTTEGESATKDATTKDATTKDATTKDATTKDATTKDGTTETASP
ncbi:MAG: tetratricopeptide repeat protein [Myxococcota bacterium]